MESTAPDVEVVAQHELTAELNALQLLAAKHRREYVRLRTAELARLTGQPVKFKRDRWTQEQLETCDPVVSANGIEMRAGQRVKYEDGTRGVVQRVDRRSARCVIEREDGQLKMTRSSKLTVLGARRTTAA